jgi:hypothetical protein
MKVATALEKLEASHGKRRALSLIGFAMFVDMYGASAMRRKYDRMTVWRDLKALEDAGVVPALIDWGEVEAVGQTKKAKRSEPKRTAVTAIRRTS